MYEKLLNAKFSPKLIALVFVFALVYSVCGVAPAASGDSHENEAANEVETVEGQSGKEQDSQGLSSTDMKSVLSVFTGSSGESEKSTVDSGDDAKTEEGSSDEGGEESYNDQVYESAISSSGDFKATAWRESSSPDYYRICGKAIIAYDVRSEAGSIEYGGMDELGRTTWAAGTITHNMRKEAQQRGRLGFTSDCDNISGWGHNGQVTIPSANSKSRDYNGYFYNRSHLIADSLGGDAKNYNLVTGTRCQNVGNCDNCGGMAYAERIARDYLDKHENGWIYYAATPVYEGDELVPRSVFVDMKSDDSSIDQHIEVYNAAKGYAVNYMDGSFSKI